MRRRLSNIRLSISTRLTLWYGLSLLILLSLFVIFVLFQSPNFRRDARLAPALPDAVKPADVSRAWQGVPARSRYAPLKDDQERRLPTDFGVRDELTDLAETLNALLARLDASFERECRFRADAAHEMFTPLSAIQSEIDVALRKPREAAYYQETLATFEVRLPLAEPEGERPKPVR